MSAQTSAPRSRSAVAWSRRLASARATWHIFRRDPAGLTGALILLLVILIAVLAPVIASEDLLDVTQQLEVERYAPPSAQHPLGTDNYGREIWARMVWGAQTSLVIGIAATAMSMVIGTVMGLAAGTFTGWVGGVLMRIVDFFLVLPTLLLAIVLAAVLDRGVITVVIAIGVTSWASTARVVRAQALSVQARPFVERSRVLGAGPWHIIGRHLLPSVLPLIWANTTLTVGSAIIAESTLAFLGVGGAGEQSWGSILKNAMDVSAATSGYWWFILTPGVGILLVVLAFTLVGRSFEAIANPTLRSR